MKVTKVFTPVRLYEDSRWKETALSKLEVAFDDVRNECANFSDIEDVMEYGKDYKITISIELLQ